MPLSELLYCGTERDCPGRPALRETLSADQEKRVKVLLASEFGGSRSDATSRQKPRLAGLYSSPPREPLPEPKLPELRDLIRYVCKLESGELLSGEGPDDRRKRREEVAVESGIESFTKGEHLACLAAASRLVRLCIFEGGEEIAILDREGRRKILREGS
jgi:hypothetical protein